MGLSNFFFTTVKSMGSVDTDAAAFIAVAGIVNTAQRNAIYQLVTDLKSSTLWSKLIAIYPMVGGIADSHKFNLKSAFDTDAANRLQFVGAPIHNTNGVYFNSAGYARTFLSVTHPTDLSLTYYVQTPATSFANDVVIGAVTNGGQGIYIQSANGGNNSVYTGGNGYGIALKAEHGLLHGNSFNGVANLFLNGAITATTAVGGANESEMYIGSLHYNGTATNGTASTCSFSSIGYGFTDSEAMTFSTIVASYQTALGR